MFVSPHTPDPLSMPRTWLTRTMVKLAGSVSTASQATVLGPVMVQPVPLVGWVTWNARAEAAKARRAAMERMVVEVEELVRVRFKDGSGEGTWGMRDEAAARERVRP